MSKNRVPLAEVTLFTLHECMQDAFVEASNLPAPMLGQPAEFSKNPDLVSDAMFDAVDENRAKEAGKRKMLDEVITASFMMERKDKAVLDQICQENGTTASGFLRACARRLIAEYRGER